MRLAAWMLALAGLPGLWGWAARADVAKVGGPTLTFVMDRSAPSPGHFEIEIDSGTGRGFYEQSGDAGAGAGAAPAPRVPIAVDPATLKKLLATVPAVERHRCESHSTNVAKTGRKTLRYAANGAAVECSYNYSDDNRVNEATGLFEALGETMQFGQQLAIKLRFDRLGLDEVMDQLTSAVEQGEAVGLGNIAPVLEAIAGDDRVMDRVQRKANSLLAQAGIQPRAASAVAGDGGSSDR